MPQVRAVSAQRDFSAGEVDPELKRDDERPEFKAGLRQCSNFRILNSRKLANRSGRRALFVESDRVEEILMAPSVTYYFAFPNGFFRIYNSAWVLVFGEARPWNAATAKDAVWTVSSNNSICVTFAGMKPRIYTWDGATTWAAADFAEDVTTGNQKRTVFYRISPRGWTMFPSATTGNITVQFSANFLVANHVGTRMRYIGRQIEITAINSPSNCNATVREPLPASQTVNVGSDPRSIFNTGDVVQGTVSNARGLIIGLTATTIGVQYLNSQTAIAATGAGGRIPAEQTIGFVASDIIVGPGGSIPISSLGSVGGPNALTIWDEEVMNAHQGWPASCFFDQNRLGFCNFPTVTGGIAWSAIGNPNDLYVGANPVDAIFELAPNKSQVLYVIPGMDSSEFVFCDNRLYYIPITVTNPLKPGSVQFSAISEDECGAVQPRRAGEFILYVTGGLNQVMAVRISGAYTRYYRTEPVTELSGHLFTSIKAIAIMTASASFSERYAFVLNQDGSVIVGKYNYEKSAELAGNIGWTPWTGNGLVKWVSCKGGNILFTTSYPGAAIAELLDNSRYLDASQLYNTQPAGLPIPGGKGPLWWQAGQNVDVMDGPLGTRMMGTYLVDANGFLVPQNNAGEDFTSANLVVGQAWTATIEPFAPAAQPGQSVKQRMNKRETDQVTVYVRNSTGFLQVDLKSGTTTPTGPALGAIIQQKRIPAWNQDDDPTQPPPLREDAYEFKPLGREYDPRFAIIKDTPGPLTILEIAAERSV